LNEINQRQLVQKVLNRFDQIYKPKELYKFKQITKKVIEEIEADQAFEMMKKPDLAELIGDFELIENLNTA